MQKVIMGLGVPGSGKSTILKKFADKHGYKYICPDDIRLDLTGDPTDQSKNREVWETAYERVKEGILNGETIVFDATFAHFRSREGLIKYVRDLQQENNIDLKVIGVNFKTRLEIAKERNSKRERKVPEEVIDKFDMFLRHEPPGKIDGFDLVINIDNNEIKFGEDLGFKHIMK